MAQKYLEIVRQKGERRKTLRKVYRNIRNGELFLMAYGKLYANKGAATKGTVKTDTVDGISLARIETIIGDLKNGMYKWKPARRTHIPKSDRKISPLGMPCWSDKLVQEVLKMVMEAYYEPMFRESSHVFRPNRGCHTALSTICKQWRGTK
ncbi:RNA-directed DNA polymerase [Candidatus Vecturithrix granuli]|uniref:RNA-directed DNA polymerase n=1 Tax=Vecturithrix granuli TaxID=1499967 RepID=A0A081C1Y2_VECG1|nr:RNA-directed DNA polymerase [Candidatus Vecturithrix granuli]